jgi:hypothetical protein
MLNLFYRNRQRLLTLVLVTLPRWKTRKSPSGLPKFTTFLPGATPERVETLVTEKLEDQTV